MKFEVNITKRYLFILVGALIVLAGVAAIPSSVNFGHDADDVYLSNGVDIETEISNMKAADVICQDKLTLFWGPSSRSQIGEAIPLGTKTYDLMIQDTYGSVYGGKSLYNGFQNRTAYTGCGNPIPNANADNVMGSFFDPDNKWFCNNPQVIDPAVNVCGGSGSDATRVQYNCVYLVYYDQKCSGSLSSSEIEAAVNA